jgi:uncharacterized membrane protein YcaP (DUF421 family)
VGIEILVSYLSLKNDLIRKVVNGSPVVLIKNGEIMKEELVHNRYTIHDLLTQLREKEIFNISDVEFAVLETSGELTVIPKSQKRSLTPEDLGLDTNYEGLPLLLIEDGKINDDALNNIDLDKKWIIEELRKRGIDDPAEVLVLALETDGSLYISSK